MTNLYYHKEHFVQSETTDSKGYNTCHVKHQVTPNSHIIEVGKSCSAYLQPPLLVYCYQFLVDAMVFNSGEIFKETIFVS